MKIIRELKQKAKNKDYTIVLPEVKMDERVLKACEIILKQKISKIVVFGKVEELPKIFQSKLCRVIDIENFENLKEYAEQLYDFRKHKGLTLEEANNLIKIPIYFSMMLLKNGVVDGVVAGAKYSSADVLRPALQIIKTKSNHMAATGCTLMIKKNRKPLVFGDVSLYQQPDENVLADIAVSNAEFAKKILGVEPKVAMLSYSTKASAKHEMVDKVIAATKIAQESGYLVDGEMQVDSALDVETARRKGVRSEVGGNANVLIFPDLDAGNIGYKLVARLGGYSAIGPIMLNFNKPVNDLSRGCTINEIVNTVIITKLLV